MQQLGGMNLMRNHNHIGEHGYTKDGFALCVCSLAPTNTVRGL